MGSEALEEELGKALWIWGRSRQGFFVWSRWSFSFTFFWIEAVPNDLTSSDAMAVRAGDCFGGMEIVMTLTLIAVQQEQMDSLMRVQISVWTLQL